MGDNSVDSAISELLDLRRDSRLSSPMKDQIDYLFMELRFLDLYTQCLTKWNEALQDREDRHVKESKILHINATLGEATKGLYSAGIKALETKDDRDWENLASELFEKVQLCKPKIKEDCLDFLDCSFQYKFFGFDLRIFGGCLWDSTNDLVRLNDVFPELNIQIQEIKERLQFFLQICTSKPIMDSKNKDIKDFKILIETWLHNAASMILLYWILEENKEEIESRKKIFLCTPRTTKMFLAVLKCLRLQNRLLLHLGVRMLADFFLEILQVCPLEVDIETLHNGLMFLTTFLVDPPLAKDTESISEEVESLICLLGGNEVKGVTAVEENGALVNSFPEKMNRVTLKVRQLYAHFFQDSSSFDFPNTDLLGFFNSLLENLEEISQHYTKHEVLMIKDELQSLSPFLRKISELQKEHPEIKDLWTRIVNVVYRAKICTQLLMYMNDSVWYDVKCLSDVIDEIKLLKSEINKSQDQEVYNIKVSAMETYTSPDPANKLEIGEGFVGFEDESQTIIIQLMGDSAALKIVSIFGMPGLGKTTLAKKIYDNSAVQKHFDKQAWCSVSQTFQTKKLFVEILSGIDPNGDFSTKTEEELEQLLQKSLFGQKYLIVMDDIWDLNAWNALKLSFPDQKNGSRILFTSRIKFMDLEGNHDCTQHPLRQLSSEESLELLKGKLFGEEDFPPNLMGVGKQIAKGCSGLPLAIVVIAGILSKKVHDLDWWKQVAERINSQANNDCMHILELSYMHLPEFLKPCFLYFGAFKEVSVIRVRKLIQLWISEGFVQKTEEKNLEDVAKEYLMNLVARSLVMVAHRSSNGGIKACRIHDLLHDFCLEKARKENLLQVRSRNKPFRGSEGAVFKSYRICFQTGEDCFFTMSPSGPFVHSLLFLPDYSFFVYEKEYFSIGNFKLLEVLDLEDVEFNGYFPEEVLLLVLLRYLAIRYCNGTLSIPPLIMNLKNLETLRVKRYSRFGNEVSVPNTIWKMKRLRHIDVGRFTSSVLEDCEPQESSQLDHMQTFSAPSLSYGEAAEKLLRSIPKVRKLRCQFVDSSKECNQFPVLEFLEKLESLNVRYTGKSFHPRAFSFPLTLKKLTLSNFKLPWSQISTIGRLPELEVLKLLEDAFDGTTWGLQDDEFLKLKFLKLRNLNIAGWKTGDYPFPSLEQLIVEDCDKLDEIPYVFGESIIPLKKVEVRWCNPAVASSAWQIKTDFDHVEVIVQGKQVITNEVVVGFENELRKIVFRLTSPVPQLDVFPIVGMGGQGKTTLAKMVYNDPSVRCHFHVRAWCCVSSRYQIRNLFLDILRDVCDFDTYVDGSKMNEYGLAELLRRRLSGRTYLIVLDDIWDFKAWYDLKLSFPDNQNGSRILLTTRSHDVAKEICRYRPRHLRSLSCEESWELLQMKLFDKSGCSSAFVEVGREIAAKCNGLPLAIVVTAGLLSKGVDDLDWWKQIAKSDLDSHIADKGGMELLELSYKDLPEFLKSCFLYLGAFPEGKEIRARRLIQLWVAEGFVPKCDGKSLEDVAKEYLWDLISRSLVKVSKRSSTGGIKACQIDSLVFYFCLVKCHDEKFLQVESCNDLFLSSKATMYKDCRLCIRSGGDVFSAPNPSGPCVRSLRFLDHACLSKGDFFSIYNFKLLRVLDLEDMESNGYFPEEVMLLVLLTYLAIRCPHGILSIPPSIASLRYLETLRVKREFRFGDEICLPETFWRMKRLRHVDVGGFTASFPGGCEPDEEPLALDNIQTVSAPFLSYGGDAEKLLRRLPKVQKLRCRFNDSYDPYQKQNHFPTLGFLAELQSLNVRYGGSLFYPGAFDFPSTLKKLTLAKFMIPWSQLSIIGKRLPNLEVLKLLEVVFDREVLEVEDDEFCSLRFLKLCQLNIAEWYVSDEAFPCLEQLIVENCVELDMIPPRFGELPMLGKIQVRQCKDTVASSVQLIQEEQYDCGNQDFEAHLMDIL